MELKIEKLKHLHEVEIDSLKENVTKIQSVLF